MIILNLRKIKKLAQHILEIAVNNKFIFDGVEMDEVQVCMDGKEVDNNRILCTIYFKNGEVVKTFEFEDWHGDICLNIVTNDENNYVTTKNVMLDMEKLCNNFEYVQKTFGFDLRMMYGKENSVHGIAYYDGSVEFKKDCDLTNDDYCDCDVTNYWKVDKCYTCESEVTTLRIQTLNGVKMPVCTSCAREITLLKNEYCEY